MNDNHVELEILKCPECDQPSDGDDRVSAGMKCAVCSYA